MSTFREKYLKYDISSKRTDNLGLKGKPFQTYANAESIVPSLNTWEAKYLKYKMKYIQLKNQLGGACNCGLSHSSSAACPNCRLEMPAAAVVMGNPMPAAMPTVMGDAMPAAAASSSAAAAEDINVTVVTLSGNNDSFPISPYATILELKSKIQASDSLGYLEIYRQRLMYRAGRYGMDPLANDLTLRQCDIGQKTEAGEPIEVDLLLEDDLRTFGDPRIQVQLQMRISRLMRTESETALAALLSQYTGDIVLRPFSNPQLITDAGAIILGHALMGNTTVHRLHLQYNGVGDEGARALADALRGNSTLIALDLQSNGISDVGARALADALRGNSTLRGLYLKSAQISDECAHEIFDMMISDTTIRFISIRQYRISR